MTKSLRFCANPYAVLACVVTSETLFRADPAGGHIVVPLDHFTAIFHRRSGQTHIVSDPVPQIVALLETGPLSASGVFDALAADNDLSADGDVIAALTDRLVELETIGLVTRA